MIGGPLELAVIIAIILLLFGQHILPRVGNRIGQQLQRLRYVDEDFNDGRD